MAFCDWSSDGKKYFTDDFTEYQIYKQSTKKIPTTYMYQEAETKYQHLELL